MREEKLDQMRDAVRDIQAWDATPEERHSLLDDMSTVLFDEIDRLEDEFPHLVDEVEDDDDMFGDDFDDFFEDDDDDEDEDEDEYL